jgi:heat shock protein HslJ
VIDRRTDVYGLGVLLYEMLIGQAPLAGAAPAPRSRRPDLSIQIEKVILKAMAPYPEQRFQTAGEFGDALAAAVRPAAQPVPPPATPVLAAAPAAAPQPQPKRDTSWIIFLMGGLFIIVLILGVLFLFTRDLGDGGEEGVVPPTATPLPTVLPPPEISFGADSTSITQGDCTTLRWNVENVQSVWLYPLGEPYDQYPVTGQGNQEVCPETTTTYELRVELASGEVLVQQVTIQVEPRDPLANTSWQLASMYVGQVPLPGTSVTLSFGADGTLSGNGGCNDYSGNYSVDGNILSIGRVTTTRQSCGEDVDAQEGTYLTALQTAATYELIGSQLVIYDSTGQEVLRLNRTG